MGKIHPNQLENYDDEPIKHQKIKKRTKNEPDDQNTEKSIKTKPKK